MEWWEWPLTNEPDVEEWNIVDSNTAGPLSNIEHKATQKQVSVSHTEWAKWRNCESCKREDSLKSRCESNKRWGFVVGAAVGTDLYKEEWNTKFCCFGYVEIYAWI